MDELRIIPYLYEYVQTNRYTLYALIVVATFFLIKPGFLYSIKSKYFSSRKILLLALILTVLLRVFWLSFSSHEVKTQYQNQGMGETDLINLHAIDLTKGIWFRNLDGSPSGRRPIGYPIFLGAFYSVFGPHITVAWTIQILLALSTVILIYYLGKLSFNKRVGALAALFFSFYPVSVYSIKQTLDEHLFLPLVYFGLFLLIREIQTSYKKWSWLWYGLIFGYATMTRTHAIILPVVVASAYLYAKFPKRRILLSVVSIFIVMQAINMPWVIRNYRAWKVPVVYTATAGFVYSELNSSARGKGGGRIPVKGEEGFTEEMGAATNVGEYHQACMKAALKWCVDHPIQCAVLGTEKILEFMGVNRRGVWPIWHQYQPGTYDKNRPLKDESRKFFEEAANFSYYLLFFSFLFGVILVMRIWKRLSIYSRKGIVVISSFLFFYLCEHFFIYADRKYRYPIEGLMMIFACAFFDRLLFKTSMEDVISFLKRRFGKWKKTNRTHV